MQASRRIFYNAGAFAVDTFYEIEPQKRSRVTKLGAQTQHRVIQRFLPPSASKQAEKMCAMDKCVVFQNIGKALSGSTDFVLFIWRCRFFRIFFCTISTFSLYGEYVVRSFLPNDV